MSEGYQKVARLSQIADGACLAAELDGHPIVLVRRGQAVAALENRCPHAGAPLSEGFVEGSQLTCSWHGWSFEIATGACPDDPTVTVPVFQVRLDGDDIWVKR